MTVSAARRLAPVAAGLVVLALWQWGAAADPTQARLVPAPAATVRDMVRLAGDGAFRHDVLVSLTRMVTGAGVSAVVAIPLGVGLSALPLLRDSVRWLVDALRYTPVTAFIPLLVLLLGIGEANKIAVIVLGTAPYTATLTASSLSKVPQEILDSARTLGIGRLTVLRRFSLPYAAPDILVALRVSLALAWTYLLTAELVGATSGLGQFMIRAQRFLRVEDVVVAVVVVGVIGWGSDYLLRLLHRRLFRWTTVASGPEVEAV